MEMKRIVDADEVLCKLPEELIRVIVSFIPLTEEIRTYQAFLVTSRQYGLSYILKPCKEFLALLQCYLKTTLIFTDIEKLSPIFSSVKKWILAGSQFTEFRFNCYIDHFQNKTIIRLSPFLSFLRLVREYSDHVTTISNAIIKYNIPTEEYLEFVHYVDDENNVLPLRKVDGMMVLRKEGCKGDWKKTLNYGGWLTRGRGTDMYNQVVYKGHFLSDEENTEIRSRCFVFNGPDKRAHLAYNFYRSAQESPFQALLDEYPD